MLASPYDPFRIIEKRSETAREKHFSSRETPTPRRRRARGNLVLASGSGSTPNKIAAPFGLRCERSSPARAFGDRIYRSMISWVWPVPPSTSLHFHPFGPCGGGRCVVPQFFRERPPDRSNSHWGWLQTPGIGRGQSSPAAGRSPPHRGPTTRNASRPR